MKPLIGKHENKEEEKKEEIKEECVKEIKKKYIKRNKPIQRIRLEIHNDDSSSEEEIKPVKKRKTKKVVFEGESKVELEPIVETPVNYHSDRGMIYKHPQDLFGRPI